MNWYPDAAPEWEEWTPSTFALNNTNFASEVAAHSLVIVHFWAVWNHIDRPMDVSLQELIPLYSTQIQFRSFDMDLDQEGKIGLAYDVLNVPALGCFIEGRHHETSIGLRPTKELADLLAKWISEAAEVG